MSNSNRAQHGIILVVGAMVCFGMLDTLSKFIGSAVPVVMAMASRFAFQAVVTGGMLLPKRGRDLFRTRHPGCNACAAC